MEYWLIDGLPEYCDGDAGVDVPNHEIVVIEHILSKYDLDIETYGEMSVEACHAAGMTDEEISICTSFDVDPREYGLRELGWKRVKGRTIETYWLTPDDLEEIANGLYEIFAERIGEMAPGMLFDIDVASQHRFYQDIPWSVIDAGCVEAIAPYHNRIQVPV